MFKKELVSSQKSFQYLGCYSRLLLNIMAESLKEPEILNATITDESYIIDFLSLDSAIQGEQLRILSKSLEFNVTKNIKMTQAAETLREIFSFDDYNVE